LATCCSGSSKIKKNSLSVGNIPQGTPVLAEGFYLLSRRFTNKQTNKQRVVILV
jgi:hypothetical protein